MQSRDIIFRRVRRSMIVGLLLSVLGNRVVEYGFHALTAADIVPVIFLVVISSLGRIIVIGYPIYAKFLSKYSPDKTLAFTDICEGCLSALACVWIVVMPHHAVYVVVIYMVVDTFLVPVTDIAEEYYGAYFAQIDEKTALTFNASLHSALAISGFIVGGGVGALLAGVSIAGLMLVNSILSFIGGGFRYTARHLYPVPAPVHADAEEHSLLGVRMPVRQFIHDILLSGPASPLLSLTVALAGTMTGELFFLWVAGQGIADILILGYKLDAFSGMGVTLTVFGIGAAVGPHVGRYLKKFVRTEYTLRIISLMSVILISGMALWVSMGVIPPTILLLFVFLLAVLGRARLIVLETHRQVYFKGKQFARIMSWSFSFGALGTILGLNIGYWFNQANNPLPCLIIGAILWAIITPIVSSTRVSRRIQI